MDYSIKKTNSETPHIKPPSKKIIFIVAVLLIIDALVVGVTWYWQKNNAPQYAKQEDGVAELPLPESWLPESWNPAPNTAVQWRGHGAPLPDLNLVLSFKDDLNPSFAYEIQPAHYYDIGTNGDNKIILAEAPAIDPSGPVIFFFEQTPAEDYRFMAKMADPYREYNSETQSGYVFSDTLLTHDTTTFYEGIVGPVSVTYRGMELEQKFLYPSLLFQKYLDQQKDNNTIELKKIDTLPSGDIYRWRQTTLTDDDRSTMYVQRYIIKLQSGLYTMYDMKYDFFSDNSVPDITWSDGTKNQDSYRKDVNMGGCGNPGAYVTPARDVAGDLKITGATGTGENIYEFKNMRAPEVTTFYNRWGRAYNETTQQFEPISLASWYAHHPVILYKNSIGEYVIFTNDNYGSAAECGKPVIYLYPTKPTNVNVKVGADITKSEPLYDNGWQVLANPDGALKTKNGNAYDSLFWEGTGHGAYPAVTEGFIVRQNDLETTIRMHLKKLGLNHKESADFLEFWLLKMPTTPYVRLTWFTTKQMDALAPLVIFPKPDTTIRIFLDFQGLENKISLPAQHLTAPARNGFTAVEWGGILKP